MARATRILEGGLVYHVLNRSNGRRAFLHKPADFDAWLRVLAEAKEHIPMRVLGFCLMPNHFHLVLWSQQGEELYRFVGWLSQTHTQRWHAHYHHVGTGHLYQGRFKAFPVQEDDHFYALVRYVERNALRAGLVERAEDWLWGSLWDRCHGVGATGLFSAWPLPCPDDWVERVNAVQSAAELEAIRHSVQRGRPYGQEAWTEQLARRLQLGQSLRPLGRPRKRPGLPAVPEQRGLFD